MEQCDEEDKFYSTHSSRMPLLRQMFVCSGVTVYYFIYGLFFGAPTVFVPQIRKEANSTDAISMEMMSWLVSISNYASLPWAIICPIIANRFGRKAPYLLLWIGTMVSVLLFYFSTSVVGLLISGFFQGLLPSVQIAISVMILTEYTSPRYRGVLITFKGATFYWGIWTSNAVGAYFHWKNIGLIIFVCCIYNCSIYFWPESPYWYANKGRFEECAKVHRWLKGENRHSERELKELISTQKENLKRKNEYQHTNKKNIFIKVYNIIKDKRFYKPLLLSFLTMCLYHFTGKLAYTGYIIDIIKNISSRESIAYEGMLILDGITVFGMYIGVILTKFLKRRTVLLVSSSTGISFLFILSIYLYLIHLEIILENKYVTLLLLSCFSVTISCGPMILSMCFTGELTPLKYRASFLCVFTLLHNTIAATIIKITPFVFKYFQSHGAFLFYAGTSSIFIYILYKVLPETKDKTIQEIENYFLGNVTMSKENVALMNHEIEQAK